MPEPPGDAGSNRTLEIAHILFMDIVAYSQLPMDEQTRLIEKLQQIVRNTTEFSRAQKRRQLLRLPTGDGMALVFFGDAEAPVRCALEISRALREQPDLKLRMGIHTGPVQRVEDINANRNVAGGGINIAQRVMDCGDAGHVLVSKTVADVLEQVSTWSAALHDLGAAEVKHGIHVHLYNLYTDEAGNQELPQKFRTAQTIAATARSQAKRKKLSMGVVTGAIAVLSVAGIVWVSYYWLASSPVPFQKIEITRLTTSGKVKEATISPDGRYVAYVIVPPSFGKHGKESLWVKQIVSGSDMQIAEPADADYLGLTFSHDGDFLYAVKSDSEDTGVRFLYKVPVLGGAAKRLIAGVDSKVTLSPDGREVAFLRDSEEKHESVLTVANEDGSGERRVAVRKHPDRFEGIAWSPNGKTIATTTYNREAAVQSASLIEVPVQGGAERPLTEKRFSDVRDLAWVSDGRGLVANGHDRRGLQIIYLSYRNGELHRITNDDLIAYNGVSLSVDSRALATVQEDVSSDAWVAPLAKADMAKPITSGGQAFCATWSPDGRIVCSKASNIWVMDSDGRKERQLTVNTRGADSLPRVSPDGRYVVFLSLQGTSLWPYIWRVDMDGNNAKQLTNTPTAHFSLLDISPDGKWVVYTKEDASIWKVAIDGGEPVRLNDGYYPVISPDGKWIAYSYQDNDATPQHGVAIMPFDGGSPTRRIDVVTGEPIRWDINGRSFLFYKDQDGVGNIWRQPIEGGKPTQITHFVSDLIYGFDLSRDGKQLLTNRGRETSDAVLIRDLR
jgi:Tol biopolymer transport system component/class 3 adenylate cyclase